MAPTPTRSARACRAGSCGRFPIARSDWLRGRVVFHHALPEQCDGCTWRRAKWGERKDRNAAISDDDWCAGPLDLPEQLEGFGLEDGLGHGFSHVTRVK